MLSVGFFSYLRVVGFLRARLSYLCKNTSIATYYLYLKAKKKKESECFVATARSAGMDLQDYDVRKHFHCWNPSSPYPASVPLCLQGLAVFLFVS